MSEDIAPRSNDVGTSDPSPAKVGGGQPEPELPAPTLGAYYKADGPKPALWLKAVQAAKLKSFEPDDVEAARQGLAVHDPQLRRTIALAQARSASTAVRRWISEATQTSLEEHLGTITIDLFAPAAEQLGRIADVLLTSR
jgi:hypothetical protein